jgi:hypothetical protein
MRALVLVLAMTLLSSSALAARGDARDVRVLVLSPMGDVAPTELKLLGDAVLDSFRGNDNVLIAGNKQVRAESPLVADRLGACVEELCLYEAGDAIRAEFVVFATATKGAEGSDIRVALLEVEAGELIVDESTTAPNVAAALPAIEAAMSRVLAPILVGTRPNVFEQPTFLTGAGLVFLGGMTALGGLGWAAEMELALADPARHRDEKQFALDNGHRALWMTGFGLATTAIGAGVLAWAVAE